MRKIVFPVLLLILMAMLPALAAGEVNSQLLYKYLAEETVNAMSAARYAAKCTERVNNMSSAQLKSFAPALKTKYQAKTVILASLLELHRNISQVKIGNGSLAYYNGELKRAVMVLVINPINPAANNY